MTQLDLLTPCRVPPKGSQCYRLLEAMQAGKKLTIWNAMAELGVGALHQRIGDLRDLGWPVVRREVVKNGKRVAEFSLSTKGEDHAGTF